MSSDPDETDVPESVAGSLRSGLSWYRKHSTLIHGSLTAISVIVTVLAAFAPTLLDSVGRVVARLLTSNVTLVVLIFVVIGQNRKQLTEVKHGAVRADGGNSGDTIDPILVLLVGLVGAAVGTTAGDQWVVPGFVIAVTFYLIFWTD
jgi:SNF family Na+-dependent transporter